MIMWKISSFGINSLYANIVGSDREKLVEMLGNRRTTITPPSRNISPCAFLIVRFEQNLNRRRAVAVSEKFQVSMNYHWMIVVRSR